MNNQEIANQLEDLQMEMLNKLSEMEDLLHKAKGEMIYERARSYWLAHIEMALTDDHSWLGGSMVSCDGTLKELREEEDDEDE